MDAPRNPQSDDHPSPRTSSPTTPSSSSSCSTNTGALLFPPAAAPAPAAPPPPTPPPSIPRTIPRSDGNPYPTTFIQADTTSFKQVVQMLTGSAETAAKHSAGLPAPPSSRPLPPARPPGPKKPVFKLYERRGSFRHLKMISPLLPNFLSSSAPASPAAAFSPRKLPEILSPSMLDLPSLSLSPVTPLIHDPFNRCSPRPPSSASSSMSEEEMAIAEKGFYLHPSPRTTPRDAEPPRLLPLFPVTSPRIPSAGASPPP